MSNLAPFRNKHDLCSLSLDQEHLWFVDQLEPNSSAYNLCTAFRLMGTPHLGALEESLNEIVRRHETLRTTFTVVDGVPHQVIAPASKINLEQVDLSQIPEAEREERLKQLIRLKGRAPFNLATGPLFRPSLLHLTHTEKVLVISWHHIITDKLSHEVLWRELAVLYDAYVEGIVSDPEKRLTDLPLLTAGETTQLLAGRNNTSYEYPRNKTLHRLFEEQAARTPNAVALVFEAQQLSYAELNEWANRVARQLRSMGVGAGMLVGLYFERSLEMLVGMLGILKAGGAYVPLDPSYPPERLSYMLKDAKIEILLTQNRLSSPLPGSELRRLCLDSDWEVIAGHNGENLSEETVSESLAYVIYTSGSTGRPKGVQIPHRAVVNLLDSMRRQPGLAEVDTVLARTRVSFDMSVFELFLPLVVGARLVIAGDEVVADGGRLSRMLATCGATAMVATPATWLMLIEAGWQGQSGLKILCGGEAMSRHLADQLLEREAELWNLYGPTETTVWSSIARVHQGDGLPVIGGAINNTQLYVLDRNFCLAPIGVSGELYIGGLGLANGYFNRPDLTAEKFIPHPFSHTSGARLYRTGDGARVLPDGNVEFAGRLDHQVKLRGFRIELGEIESVLNEHPSIRESVVILGEDIAGDKRLIAYLVIENGVELAGSELRHFLQEKLPAFMIPSQFVSLDQMPLTLNGKVDRQSLPALAGKQLSQEKNYVIPRTPLENSLADIWAEILQLERVGADESFFELGGHSLTATRVISQIRDRLQREISLQEFFNSPTVAELAQRIESGISTAQRESVSSIVPVPRVRVRMAAAKSSKAS